MDIGYQFIIICALIIVVGMVIIYKFNIDPVDRFRLVISYLGGVSVLLVIYNLFITFQFDKAIEKNRIVYNTVSNIQNNFLKPQKELVDYYPEGYFLYASMNPDIDLKTDEPKNFDPIKRKEIETYASLRIFQSMEDFLSTAAYDITGIYVWVNNYLMWLQSPILQANWIVLGFNFSKDTRAFVNRLIEKANDLIALRKQKGSLSIADYDAISDNFEVKYR
jgi:hypothetical protein